MWLTVETVNTPGVEDGVALMVAEGRTPGVAEGVVEELIEGAVEELAQGIAPGQEAGIKDVAAHRL